MYARLYKISRVRMQEGPANMPNLTVECDVEPGLFKTEYLVWVLRQFSFYTDRQDVQVQQPPAKGQTVKGQVRAYLVEERNGEAVIEMTGTPVEGGIRISVPKAITHAA
jgi:hypothetical protein